MDRAISSLMTTPAWTVRATDTVRAIHEKMHRYNLSFVPVVDGPDDIVVGVISAGDLLQFQLAKRDPDAVHAWEICSYKPIEVGPDASLADVARKMVAAGVHHVIVTENAQLKGVVSSMDFVRQFMP